MAAIIANSIFDREGNNEATVFQNTDFALKQNKNPENNNTLSKIKAMGLNMICLLVVSISFQNIR